MCAGVIRYYLIVCVSIICTRDSSSQSTHTSAKMTDLGRHIRSPLGRSIYYKMIVDQAEQERDHSAWYMVRRDQISGELCEKLLDCHKDEDTKLFLEQCVEKSDWLFTQLGHMIARSFLGWFMTPTSINGLLSRGSMFVYSRKQFQDLLGVDPEWRTGKLLDIGAGDGMVTRVMGGHFEEVYATETSTPMRWRLQEKGYNVLEIDEWSDGSLTFDVVSCLNLLDRCDRPFSILRDIRQVLTPGTGRLVVALVVPFKPYVEFGSRDHKPTENILVQGKTFEEQVASLVTDLFEPAGYSLERFTRLPYLCEGDLERSFFMLDDAVFVLKPT